MEASKASTGTHCPCPLERLDFGQLVQQALEENMREKFAQAGLTPVLDQGDGCQVILATKPPPVAGR